ncbi:MAG: TadE/TadG family type IV pilus assembly protein [Bryobacteraceae bacterium]
MPLLRRRDRGMVLVATGMAIFVLIGMLGVAVDFGRIYITKNEAQAYADACALMAVRELDGTPAGIALAQAKVAESQTNVVDTKNRWGFATNVFSGTDIKFANTDDGPWEENPENPAGFRFARVTARVDNLPMLFLVAVGTSRYANVRAIAVAGQVRTRPSGILPFSPVSQAPYYTSADTAANPPSFGFDVGAHYTLMWPANPSLGNGQGEGGGSGNMVCPPDSNEWMIGKSTPPGGNDWRGYIQENDSQAIRAAIEDDQIQYSVNLDDAIHLTGGEKSTMRIAMYTRFHQDTDQRVGITYSQYTGNGRRLIALAVNGGFTSNDGVTPLAGNLQGRIVGYGLFFMYTDDYDQGANSNWCAEYVSDNILEGSNNKGAGGGGPGVYVVRLVR